MDEWVENGQPVPVTHPLSFAKADLELCFNRIDPALRMPDDASAFPHRRPGGVQPQRTTTSAAW